jgi:hypothetical protein
MKTMRIMCVFAAILAAGSASAFQEQTQGGPATRQAAPRPADTVAPLVTPPSAPQGTEVRVPGFGKLGVLPKMDFGLELLYGASEPRQSPAPNVDETDNLAIRGSVKHKF